MMCSNIGTILVPICGSSVMAHGPGTTPFKSCGTVHGVNPDCTVPVQYRHGSALLLGAESTGINVVKVKKFSFSVTSFYKIYVFVYFTH